MYEIAEQEFGDLLVRQKYPQLMDSSFSYKVNDEWTPIAYKSLLRADGSPDEKACRAAASIIVAELKKSGGVREQGTLQRVKGQLWSGQICRGLGSEGQSRIDGAWWFQVELMQRWENVYAAEPASKRRKKVTEAIRPMLAVRLDWNDLLSLVTMTPGGAGIPVITAQGTHQPIKTERDKSGRDITDRKVVFIGGYQQVYVPFVPVDLVRNYA